MTVLLYMGSSSTSTLGVGARGFKNGLVTEKNWSVIMFKYAVFDIKPTSLIFLFVWRVAGEDKGLGGVAPAPH